MSERSLQEESAVVARNEVRAAVLRVVTWVLIVVALPAAYSIIDNTLKRIDDLGTNQNSATEASIARDDELRKAIQALRDTLATERLEIERRLATLEATNANSNDD